MAAQQKIGNLPLTSVMFKSVSRSIKQIKNVLTQGYKLVKTFSIKHLFYMNN